MFPASKMSSFHKPFSSMASSLSKTLKLPKPYIAISPFSTTSQPLPPPPPSPSPAAAVVGAEQRGQWSKLLLFIPGAITFGLGTWQIFRRQDKIEMLEYRRERLELEPFDFTHAEQKSCDQGLVEFRKVVTEGVFDEEKSIFLGPRSRSISGVTENGYYLITPLLPTNTDPRCSAMPFLVNRGWVPRDWRNRHVEDSQTADKPSNSKAADVQQDEKNSWWNFWSRKPSYSQVKEPTITPARVTGVIRRGEKPSIFVPANDPKSGQWFYVDVPMMVRACGLPEGTVYIEDINEDASATNPYPVPKDVNTLIHYSVMPQDHLNYTLTWYSLSAAVTFMAFKRIKPKRTRR